MKRFSTLTPLMYLFVPPSLLRTLPKAIKLNRQEVDARIKNRGNIKHPDYLQQLCPNEGDLPTRGHLEQVAGQLLMAGYDPVSNVFYSTIYFLLKEPAALRLLAEEISGAFSSYAELEPAALFN